MAIGRRKYWGRRADWKSTLLVVIDINVLKEITKTFMTEKIL